MQHILYLHGFLSSPKSIKAQATKAYFEQHHSNVTLHIPELSNFPSKVEAQLITLIETTPALRENGLKLIGSSMGGYLSTYLLEKFGGKAVLINPAVRPYELLQGFIGAHENPYSKEKFEIVESDMGVIQALEAASIKTPGITKCCFRPRMKHWITAWRLKSTHKVIWLLKRAAITAL